MNTLLRRRRLDDGPFVRGLALLGAFALFVALPARAALAEDAKPAAPLAPPLAPASAVDTARAFAPSFAHVEIELRYDDGDAPETLGSSRDEAALVTDERPLELAAIVLAPDRLLVADPQIPPRFVAKTTAVFGAQRVTAKPFSFAIECGGAILALERPLEGAKPVLFDAAAKGPYRTVSHGKDEGVWATVVGSAFQRVSVEEDGRVTGDASSPALVIDRAGAVAGVTLADTAPLDSVWKGSPLSWPTVSLEERDRLVAKTEALANASLMRVHLRLRSPKTEREERYRFRHSSDEDGQGSDTERDRVGVLVDSKRVLVIDALDSKATARLESVAVHPASGDAVPAKFVGSLKHYGALLVELERPMEGAARLAAGPIRRTRETLLLTAKLDLQGEHRVLHCSHGRLSSFEEGWRRQIIPSLGYSSTAEHYFLFDRDGALLAIPLTRRLPERTQRWRRDDSILLPSEYVAPLLADLPGNTDLSNVPVAAEREGRLAWLGVETQRLDRDLARANGVSHLTQDGETGALVSYVYPGSPAQKAGIEPGAVLLRIHAPDRPKPIDIAASEDPFASIRSMLGGFDSDDGDDRFGMISGFHPWPSAENEVNRSLTDIGIGKTVTLEYVVGTEVKKAEMPVSEAPVHFEAAPLQKSEALGTTVRDLTYEVRRYYQLDDKLAGVIVSKVERGGRAAVAGLKTFDIVLRVNDEPVGNAAAFSKCITSGVELRLAVKDRLKERIVKIAAGGEKPGGAKSPGPKEGGGEDGENGRGK